MALLFASIPGRILGSEIRPRRHKYAACCFLIHIAGIPDREHKGTGDRYEQAWLIMRAVATTSLQPLTRQPGDEKHGGARSHGISW